MNSFIIPVFLPQMGCPHHCLYCQQEKITQTPPRVLTREAFTSLIETGLSSRRKKSGQKIEIAFYGGTFTNLPMNFQKKLFEWSAPYLAQKIVTSIRLSTRPDVLSENKLDRLFTAGVRTIELGVQSLNDTVLERIRRGHTAQEGIQAIKLLKKFPITVGVQLMAGLPGDRSETFMQTIEQVIPLKPDLVRIYPTLVFKDTPLAEWWREGRYSPLTLDESVALCSQALEQLEAAGIQVIRLGLQEHEGLRLGKDLLAGPYHPAFGFLVRGETYVKRLLRDLTEHKPIQSPLILHLAPRDGDYLLGNGQKNLTLLRRRLEMDEISIKIDLKVAPGSWQKA